MIRVQPKDTNHVFELVPPDKLKRDLPAFLVEEHVHWLDLSTSIIEIRPLKSLWEQSRENWRIAGADGKYHAYKGCKSRLVDMQSQTWAMVSGLLKCFDLSENLVVTTSTIDSSPTPQLSVTLPRYSLSFFVNDDGDLESDDFKEMVYDKNQCIGTLFGLVNQLVLRGKNEAEEGLVPRYVLIPLNDFRHCTASGPVIHYVYKVDTELGCLTGNPSWESKYFLSYLHAKTSVDWRPDPLTSRTGAQEALSILHSAGYQSLKKSHGRNDYEYKFSTDISPLYPQLIIAESGKATTQDDESLPRGAKRAAYLFSPNDISSTSPGDGDNIEFVSSLPDPQLEDIAFTAAYMAYHRLIDQDVSTSMSTVSNWAEIWGDAMSEDTTHSPSPYDEALWDPNYLQALLIKLHDILRIREGHSTRQRFLLIFLLPTLGYCSSHPQTAFLSLLLAFVKTQHRSVNHTDHKLVDGYSPTRKVLYHHIRVSCYESRDYDWAGDHSVDAALQCLLKGWPSNTVPTFSLDSSAFDTIGLTHTLQALFSSCHRNLKLKQDLTRVLRKPHPVPTPHSVSDFGWSSSVHLHISRTTSIRMHTASYDYDSSPPVPQCTASSSKQTPKRSMWPIALDRLLSEREPPILPCSTKLPQYNFEDEKYSSPDTSTFNSLLPSLRTNESDPPFQEQYISHIHASLRHVRQEYKSTCRVLSRYPIEELKKHFVRCKSKYTGALRSLQDHLGATADPLEQALARCGQWPQITTYSLLRCLASKSPIKPSETWKRCLVSFALLLLEFQRARRLLLFFWQDLEDEFSKELENEGCDGWKAEQYPDWLLIQVGFQSLGTHVHRLLMHVVARKLPHSPHTS